MEVASISGNDVPQEVIAKSDDYKTYRAEFTKAATFLVTKGRCREYELRYYGGFVNAQGGYKDQPIYFTYCGGSHLSNKIYLDVSSGELFTES